MNISQEEIFKVLHHHTSKERFHAWYITFLHDLGDSLSSSGSVCLVEIVWWLQRTFKISQQGTHWLHFKWSNYHQANSQIQKNWRRTWGSPVKAFDQKTIRDERS